MREHPNPEDSEERLLAELVRLDRVMRELAEEDPSFPRPGTADFSRAFLSTLGQILAMDRELYLLWTELYPTWREDPDTK